MTDLVGQLAAETTDWMAQRPMGEREDVADQLWAFSLATFVDGVAITPLGYDDTEQFDPEVVA